MFHLEVNASVNLFSIYKKDITKKIANKKTFIQHRSRWFYPNMRIAADLSGSCGLPGVSGILPRTGETCRTFWSYAHRQAEVRQLLQGKIYPFFKNANII
jgi:hypothetical protein